MGLDIEATKQTPFLEEVDGMYFLTLYQMHHPPFRHVECSQHMFLKKQFKKLSDRFLWSVGLLLPTASPRLHETS